MTPQERWKRVQDLSEQAEALPLDQRDAFLERVEADAAIRTEVIALLAGLENEPKAAEPLPSLFPRASMPAKVGPYAITGILGQGGMGIVYAAEIERAGEVQLVALKLIQTHLDEPEHAARFTREQKILARLDHPGITRLLDAGVSDENQPYLVMERVTGQPLDRYCDSQTLTAQARVRLMIEVCRAVEAAHRILIVHLDLKPSNILVTNDGQVKLLDFGTAKILRGDASLTTTRQLTPMYASPEQLRGEPVSTACDIYSLGLILYEQLCGAWPFGNRDSMISVASRAVGSTDTQPMSKAITEEGAQKRGVRADRLRDQLSGDLEAIVGKALAGLPKDRYASVAALSEDLERYLANRPILAQKQTTLYRTKKYVARNRGALSVSAVLAIGLLVLGGYALWQQQQALKAGRRAQATAQFLNWMIETANPINGGSPTRTVRDMIERAKPRIDKGLAEYPEVFTPLASNLGDFLYNAGRPEAGLDWLVKSVARSRQLNSPKSLLLALAPYATTLSIVGKCAEAKTAEKEMKQLLTGVESQLSAVERVNVHTAIAYPESFCDLDDAASLRSMDLAYQASKQVPNDSLETAFPARLFKGVLAVNYASSLRDGKRGTEARAVLSEGLELIQSEPDAGPVRVAILRSRSALEANEGAYLESAKTLREILKLPSEGLAPLEVVRLHSLLAVRLASAEQYLEALAEVKIAVEETERRLAELGVNAYIVYVDASVASALAGACDETQQYLERVQALSSGQIGANHVVNFDAARAVCAVKRASPAEALRLVRAVIEKHKVEEKPTRPMGKALRAAEAQAKATLEQNP